LPLLSLVVRVAEPGIFRSADGAAASLNEDGTINGPENPAKPGSIVVLWTNGVGRLDPLPTDGPITGAVLAKPVLPVSVVDGSSRLEILYAGAAPGVVAGVLQVNARLLAGFGGRNRAIQLKVGDALSEFVTIYTTRP
jgi:uncharacterized protein (TIGR03437 family)